MSRVALVVVLVAAAVGALFACSSSASSGGEPIGSKDNGPHVDAGAAPDGSGEASLDACSDTLGCDP